MEKTVVAYLILCINLLFINCKKQEDRSCFKSVGETVVVRQEFSSFDFLEVKDYVDIFLIPDSAEFVEIEGGKNLVKHIMIEQNENKLFVSNNNKCDWVRKYGNPIKIKIHYKTLTVIEYLSSGNIYSTDTLKAKKFTINQRGGSGICNLIIDTDSCFLNIHTGPGDFTVLGKTNNCIVFCNGNGFIDASKLYSFYGFVNARGTGDTKVYVYGHLDAEIAYIGNVYYLGNPPIINLQQKGEGQLLKAD